MACGSPATARCKVATAAVWPINSAQTPRSRLDPAALASTKGAVTATTLPFTADVIDAARARGAAQPERPPLPQSPPSTRARRAPDSARDHAAPAEERTAESAHEIHHQQTPGDPCWTSRGLHR